MFLQTDVELSFIRLKSNIGWQVVGADNVFIITETSSFHFRGKAYAVLLPLLQKGFNVLDVFANARGGLTITELVFAIKCLNDESLLNDFSVSKLPLAKRHTAAHEDAVFWDSLGKNSSGVLGHLEQATVHILNLSACADVSALQTGLRKQAISVQSHRDENTTLQLVIVDDYLNSDLRGVSQLNHDQKTPWLLAKPSGELMWIGPFIVPGKTACWECLRYRIVYRRKLHEYLTVHDPKNNSRRAPAANFSCASEVANSIVCAELVKFIAMQGGELNANELPTYNQVLTINSLSYQRQLHATVRRPQCSVCGNPNWMKEQQSRPVKLDMNLKVLDRDNGLRVKSAQQIKAELNHHISPYIGLIGTTNNIQLNNDTQGITYSVAAEHNFSLIDDKSSFLQEQIRSCAGGKGKTLIQAQAGALCESIERFSGVFQGDEKRICYAMKNLDNAIHPNDCLIFSKKQFQERDRLNASSTRMTWIPKSFDVEEKIEWTPLWSLTHKAFYYLPTSYCFYGYARKNNCEFAKADSNGCAAGSCLEEAVLQGFLELVERDAAALWWYNRIHKAGVDLESFNDTYLIAVQDYYAKNSKQLWVLDITSDLGVPCFVALCAKQGAEAEEITFAFGCHFDVKIALIRAVTELNQIMPNVSLDPSITLKSLGREAVDWWRDVRLQDQPYLQAQKEPLRQYGDYPDESQLGLSEAVSRCIEITQQKGLNLLVLDQTRPDTGLNVVKVVVPSLRHFWPRFGLGRLYEVKGAVNSEENFNPYPIFI